MTDIIERLSALSAVSTDNSTILTEVKAGITTDAIAEITSLRAELAHARSGTGPEVSIEDKIAKIIKDAYAGTGFEDEGRSTGAAHDIMAHVSHGWQPIETAPRDLCPLPVLWNGKFKAAFWNEDQNNWQEYPDGDFDIGAEVTHWFDLPEPPK